MERIQIFMGGYGSGKSELALAAALEKSRQSKTALVDLDIINPCFRSSEQRKLLEDCGVEVYAPTFAGTTLDLPALPARIQGVLQQQELSVFLDVGGDPDGVVALGRYNAILQEQGFNAVFVINTLRPLQRNAQDIIQLMGEICQKARLWPKGLINNTNLAHESRALHVVAGQKIVEQVADKTGIPCVGITALKEVIDELPQPFVSRYGHMIRPVSLRMRPDWLG
nr:hypothetical protein [bacterium]